MNEEKNTGIFSHRVTVSRRSDRTSEQVKITEFSLCGNTQNCSLKKAAKVYDDAMESTEKRKKTILMKNRIYLNGYTIMYVRVYDTHVPELSPFQSTTRMTCPNLTTRTTEGVQL